MAIAQLYLLTLSIYIIFYPSTESDCMNYCGDITVEHYKCYENHTI